MTEELQTVGKLYTGSAYSVEIENLGIPNNATIADIVRFEKNELGNDYGISDEEMKVLDKYNRRDTIWVTKKKSEAKEYLSHGMTSRDISKVDLPPGSRIIADDGMGGYLVLRGDAKPIAFGRQRTYEPWQMTKEEFSNESIYFHGTDAKEPFSGFKTREVWFDTAERDYGGKTLAVGYKWKKPFVTSVQEADENPSLGITVEEAIKNKELYEQLGGEGNPKTFDKLRELGYDVVIDNEGYAALYPDRVKVLGEAEAFNFTKAEFADLHRNLVRQALSEGRPVPDRVLAEYPDLAKGVMANVGETKLDGKEGEQYEWKYGAEPFAAIPGEPIGYYCPVGAEGFEGAMASLYETEDGKYYIKMQDGTLVYNPENKSALFDDIESAKERFKMYTGDVKPGDHVVVQGIKDTYEGTVISVQDDTIRMRTPQWARMQWNKSSIKEIMPRITRDEYVPPPKSKSKRKKASGSPAAGYLE